jgi:hypothetical protein
VRGTARTAKAVFRATSNTQGAAIIDAWVNTTEPGFGHAVWNTTLNGGSGAWIDDGPAGAGEGRGNAVISAEAMGDFVTWHA